MCSSCDEYEPFEYERSYGRSYERTPSLDGSFAGRRRDSTISSPSRAPSLSSDPSSSSFTTSSSDLSSSSYSSSSYSSSSYSSSSSDPSSSSSSTSSDSASSSSSTEFSDASVEKRLRDEALESFRRRIGIHGDANYRRKSPVSSKRLRNSAEKEFGRRSKRRCDNSRSSSADTQSGGKGRASNRSIDKSVKRYIDRKFRALEIKLGLKSKSR